MLSIMYLIDYKKRPKIRTKERLSTETSKTVRLLVVTLAIMIVALGSLFLNASSKSAQKGYTLKLLEDENKDLKSTNANITAKITNDTAFSKVSEDEKVLGMQGDAQKLFVTEDDNKVE